MNQKTIGDRIKFHRKKLGMTQEQLAERMGVSPQAVSKWEHNLSCPDISVLPDLADIFGITVDELLGKDAASETPVREAELVDDKEDDRPAFEFHWESKRGSILFALYVLVVGGLLLCKNFVPAMDVSWWTILWTTALVFVGVSGLLQHFSAFCLAIAAVGVGALLNAYGILALKFSWGILIPAALLLWGVSLLIDVLCGNKPWRRHGVTIKSGDKANQKASREYSCVNGNLNCDMAFGSHRTAVVTSMLRGGSVDTCFGDFTVDFSGCEAVAPNCVVEVDNSFGELTLLIPDRFEVTVEHDTAFAGGPQISGRPASVVEGTIHIKADVSFGNLNIRYV